MYRNQTGSLIIPYKFRSVFGYKTQTLAPTLIRRVGHVLISFIASRLSVYCFSSPLPYNLSEDRKMECIVSGDVPQQNIYIGSLKLEQSQYKTAYNKVANRSCVMPIIHIGRNICTFLYSLNVPSDLFNAFHVVSIYCDLRK